MQKITKNISGHEKVGRYVYFPEHINNLVQGGPKPCAIAFAPGSDRALEIYRVDKLSRNQIEQLGKHARPNNTAIDCAVLKVAKILETTRLSLEEQPDWKRSMPHPNRRARIYDFPTRELQKSLEMNRLALNSVLNNHCDTLDKSLDGLDDEEGNRPRGLLMQWLRSFISWASIR